MKRARGILARSIPAQLYFDEFLRRSCGCALLIRAAAAVFRACSIFSLPNVAINTTGGSAVAIHRGTAAPAASNIWTCWSLSCLRLPSRDITAARPGPSLITLYECKMGVIRIKRQDPLEHDVMVAQSAAFQPQPSQRTNGRFRKLLPWLYSWTRDCIFTAYVYHRWMRADCHPWSRVGLPSTHTQALL